MALNGLYRCWTAGTPGSWGVRPPAPVHVSAQTSWGERSCAGCGVQMVGGCRPCWICPCFRGVGSVHHTPCMRRTLIPDFLAQTLRTGGTLVSLD